MTKEKVIRFFDKYEQHLSDVVGHPSRLICTVSGPMKHIETMKLIVQEGISRGWFMLTPTDTYLDKSNDELLTKYFLRTLHDIHEWKLDHSDVAIFVSDNGYLGKDSCRDYIYAYKSLGKKRSHLTEMVVTEPLTEETKNRILNMYSEKTMRRITELVNDSIIMN